MKKMLCVISVLTLSGCSTVGALRTDLSIDRALERMGSKLQALLRRWGEEYERRITPSDSILGLLLKRGDMKDGDGLADIDELHE